MTSPTVSAMADQTMMAIAEAERLAPDNGQLHEHPVLSAFIRDNVGRPETEFTVENPALHGPRPVIVHPRVYDDHDAPPAGRHPDYKEPAACVLCNVNSSYKTTRRLWVSAGATIFQFHFCEFHAIAIETEYDPIVWRE
ncbi:hypothetical protein [Pseudactinotalea sp.]|uniref:hypothetical protein n=1 Tax=Pseudactinotalea sp. TaxID=1926260 RepID=UPI003B3B3A13